MIIGQPTIDTTDLAFVLLFFFPGLKAELYYVREGVVNTYAMNFVVPVPANIADLEFSWQSLAGHPVRTYVRNTE